MRKVIYSILVSLDGFIEDASGGLSWHVIDAELHKHINRQERQAGAHLYGRKMYTLMASYWQTADQDPANPDYAIEYARIWQAMPKIVFSSTLERVGENAKLVKGDAAAAVAALKAQPGGDLYASGAGLAGSLLRQGLIDEVQLYVQPVLLGRGKPMFPALEQSIPLTLIEEQTFTSGVVSLRYQTAGGHA